MLLSSLSNNLKVVIKQDSTYVTTNKKKYYKYNNDCIVINKTDESYYIWFDDYGIDMCDDINTNIRRSLFMPRNDLSIAAILFDNVVNCTDNGETLGFYMKKLDSGDKFTLHFRGNKFEEIEIGKNLFFCSEHDFTTYVGSIINSQFLIVSDSCIIEN